MFSGRRLIMMGVKSPMLAALGGFFRSKPRWPFFVGGVIRATGDWASRRRGHNAGQNARVEKPGI